MKIPVRVLSQALANINVKHRDTDKVVDELCAKYGEENRFRIKTILRRLRAVGDKYAKK